MNYLNINKKKNEETANALNTLLADYHLYYQKLRNFHWNIVGKHFFDLHTKFEELYEDAKLKIDEIAERILTLRYQPLSNYSQYMELSNIAEASTNLKDYEMVQNIIEDHGILLSQMRKVLENAEKANDDGTMDSIGTYIAEIEKVNWMLDAWASTNEDS